jgi:hypothetical protein
MWKMKNSAHSCIHALNNAHNLRARGLLAVFRVAGETETLQDNIQVELEPDGADPGYQLLTKEKITAMVFFI